jgi:hypothetical protein
MRRVALTAVAAVALLGAACETHDCKTDDYGSLTIRWNSFTDAADTTFTDCESAGVDLIDVIVDGEPVGPEPIDCDQPGYEGTIPGVPAGEHTVTLRAIDSDSDDVLYQLDTSATIATCEDTLLTVDLDET